MNHLGHQDGDMSMYVVSALISTFPPLISPMNVDYCHRFNLSFCGNVLPDTSLCASLVVSGTPPPSPEAILRESSG